VNLLVEAMLAAITAGAPATAQQLMVNFLRGAKTKEE